MRRTGLPPRCCARRSCCEVQVRVRATSPRLAVAYSGSTMRRTMEASMPNPVDRRRVILASSALAASAALPNAASAQTGLAPAADLLPATRRLLGSLEGDQRKAASFAWDGSEWRNWNYFGAAGYIKPGLRLEQMNAVQKAAAWDLLGVLFSPAGLEKTRHVMLLQDVLAASGNGTGQRSSQRFSFAVYGTPAERGA